MTTKTDIRQLRSRDELDQIAGTVDQQLDALMRSVNDELVMPLRMLSSSTPDLTFTIDPITVTNPITGRTRTIPTILNTLPIFTGGTVTLPASVGGTVTVSPGANPTLSGLTASNFIKMGISLDATGQLIIQFGIEGATVAAATTPPQVDGTFGIGYVVVEADGGGNVQVINNSDIFQYVGGGGGSGSGDANSLIETLKNHLNDSLYTAVTPNIFSQDDSDKVDISSTGVFSLTSKTFDLDAAETMVSIQMFDDAFLLNPSIPSQVDLSVFWNLANIDTAATYEVSRDGGNEYQTVTMQRIDNTDSYVGIHEFTEEAATQSLNAQATSNASIELNTTTQSFLSQSFTLTDASVIKEFDLDVTINGSPAGRLYFSIYSDSSGDPDTALAEGSVSISGLSTGTETFNIPDLALPVGTYHIVIRTDSDYSASFVTTTTSIEIDTNSGGSGSNNSSDGITWIGTVSGAFVYDVKGSELDLRVRVTASATSSLAGYGIFYDLQSTGIIAGTKLRHIEQFSSTSNPNEFVIPWVADADLLRVYISPTAQVAVVPDFEIDGTTIRFPVDTFSDGGGDPVNYRLTFIQTEGTSFDNSDENAALLAQNFLGSLNGSYDKSAPGRGILLRSPDGTLYEITIQDSGSGFDIFEVTP